MFWKIAESWSYCRGDLRYEWMKSPRSLLNLRENRCHCLKNLKIHRFYFGMDRKQWLSFKDCHRTSFGGSCINQDRRYKPKRDRKQNCSISFTINNSPYSSRTHLPNISLLRHSSDCSVNSDNGVSLTRRSCWWRGVLEEVGDLTWLIFSASARYLAPSSSSWLQARLRESSV